MTHRGPVWLTGGMLNSWTEHDIRTACDDSGLVGRQRAALMAALETIAAKRTPVDAVIPGCPCGRAWCSGTRCGNPARLASTATASAEAPVCRPWCGMEYADDHVPFQLDDTGKRRVWFDDDASDGDLDKPGRCSPACRRPAAKEAPRAEPTKPAPIPMRIPCPECKALHIDEGEFATKPHHTHSCQACGLTWRPAVEHTVGVQFLPGFKNEPKPAPKAPDQPPAPAGTSECPICGGRVPHGHFEHEIDHWVAAQAGRFGRYILAFSTAESRDTAGVAALGRLGWVRVDRNEGSPTQRGAPYCTAKTGTCRHEASWQRDRKALCSACVRCYPRTAARRASGV